MPHEIFIPSSAGPIAHEVARSFLSVFRSISPFVPISIKSIFSALLSSQIPLAYTPDTISEPKNPDICGNVISVASRSIPTSFAHTLFTSINTGKNGNLPRLSTLSPSKI